jgi:hypothetical protein
LWRHWEEEGELTKNQQLEKPLIDASVVSAVPNCFASTGDRLITLQICAHTYFWPSISSGRNKCFAGTDFAAGLGLPEGKHWRIADGTLERQAQQGSGTLVEKRQARSRWLANGK